MAELVTKNVKFLKMSFISDDNNRTISLQIPTPREDLTIEQIEPLMTFILEKKLFDIRGVSLIKKKSAEVIERTVTTQDFEITVS